MAYKHITLIIYLTLIFLPFSPGQVSAEQDWENIALTRVKDATVLYLDSPYTLVNGVKTHVDKDNSEITPLVKDGRTLVPLRFISESLGAQVDWNAKTFTATISLNNKQLKVAVGKREILVGNKVLKLDVPAEILSGRTYLPLRAIVETLDKEVFYDSGLIVISNDENIIKKDSEEKIIDLLILHCTGMGNRASNLMTFADIAQSGNWIFYANTEHQRLLYKSRTDGTQITRLSNDIPSSINAIGNWIYYQVQSGNGSKTDDYLYSYDVYKIRADGTGRVKISQEKAISTIAVVGRWIYYVNENHRLMKIRVDGKNLTQLSTDSVNQYDLAVYDDWIYYEGHGANDFGLYRIKTDGTGRMKSTDEFMACYDIADGWIYYSEPSALYKMKVDGSQKTLIRDGIYPRFIHVVGDWIYFPDYESEPPGRLYRVRLDGSELMKLNNHDSYQVAVLGDWIYSVYNWGDKNPLYKLKLDGSSEQKVY